MRKTSLASAASGESSIDGRGVLESSEVGDGGRVDERRGAGAGAGEGSGGLAEEALESARHAEPANGKNQRKWVKGARVGAYREILELLWVR